MHEKERGKDLDFHIFLHFRTNAHWSRGGQQLISKYHELKIVSKDCGRSSDKILREKRLGYLLIWELWSKRLKSHFLFYTSIYFLNQKTYFAILLKILCGFWGYANQLFRFKSDHFMALWKLNFHKLLNLKFFAADFSEFSLKIFLISEKHHNLVNFWVKNFVHLSLESSFICNKNKGPQEKTCFWQKWP